MIKIFKDIPEGQSFINNGNIYVKVSTKTAIMVHLMRTFYFSKDENCEVI